MIQKVKQILHGVKNSSEAMHFLKKLSGFSIGPIFNGLLGLVTVPLLTWFISNDEMGRASMYFTGQSLVSLILILGLDQVVVRLFHNYKNHKALVINALLPTSLLLTLFTAVGIFFTDYFSVFLYGESNITAYYFFLASIFIIFFRRYTSLAIRMNEHARMYSGMQVIFKVLYTVLLISFIVFWGASYTKVIMAHFFADVISVTIEFIYVRSKHLLSGRFIFSKKLIIKGLHFGLPLVFAGAMLWINNSFDKIAMRSLLPEETQFQQIGIYNVAFNFSNLMNIIRLSFTTFWIPVAYKWYNQNVSINRFNKVNTYMTIALSLMGLTAFFCRGLLYYVIQADYFDAISVFPFLLFVPLLFTSSEISAVGITIKKKTIYATMATVISAVINIIGNIILIPNMGAKGAAIATAISFFAFFLARAFFSNKLFGPIKIRLNIVCFASLFIMFLFFA